VRRRHRAADQRVTRTHVAVSGPELRQRFGTRPDPVDLRLRFRLQRSLDLLLLERFRLDRLLLDGLLLDRLLLDGPLLDRLLPRRLLLDRLLPRRLVLDRLLGSGPLRFLPDPLGLWLVPGLGRRRHLSRI
jgi:hypothetical protein